MSCWAYTHKYQPDWGYEPLTILKSRFSESLELNRGGKCEHLLAENCIIGHTAGRSGVLWTSVELTPHCSEALTETRVWDFGLKDCNRLRIIGKLLMDCWDSGSQRQSWFMLWTDVLKCRAHIQLVVKAVTCVKVELSLLGFKVVWVLEMGCNYEMFDQIAIGPTKRWSSRRGRRLLSWNEDKPEKRGEAASMFYARHLVGSWAYGGEGSKPWASSRPVVRSCTESG